MKTSDRILAGLPPEGYPIRSAGTHRPCAHCKFWEPHNHGKGNCSFRHEITKAAWGCDRHVERKEKAKGHIYESTMKYLEEAETLRRQLLTWLDAQSITSENIGVIRSKCSMPFACEWNAVVRDETAALEKAFPK